MLFSTTPSWPTAQPISAFGKRHRHQVGADRHVGLLPGSCRRRRCSSTWPRWPTATTRLPARARPVSRPRSARAGCCCAGVSSDVAPGLRRCRRGGGAGGERQHAARGKCLEQGAPLHDGCSRSLLRSAHAAAGQGVGRPLALGERLGVAQAAGLGDEAGQRIEARQPGRSGRTCRCTARAGRSSAPCRRSRRDRAGRGRRTRRSPPPPTSPRRGRRCACCRRGACLPSASLRRPRRGAVPSARGRGFRWLRLEQVVLLGLVHRRVGVVRDVASPSCRPA